MLTALVIVSTQPNQATATKVAALVGQTTQTFPMENIKKPDLRFRFFSWLGRTFYRFRMELEEWQFWIDGMASRYDPDES